MDINIIATSLPNGLNQLPSSTINKLPNSKEIIVISMLKARNKDNLIFLISMPTIMMNNRNPGNKKTASCLAR